MPPKKNTQKGVNYEKENDVLKEQTSVDIPLKKSTKGSKKECKLVITDLSYESILCEHLNIPKPNRTLQQNTENSSKNNVEYVEEYNMQNIIRNIQNNNQNTQNNLEKRVEYFLDSKKNKIKLWPTMIDRTSSDILSLYTNKPCRNCHHQYDNHPIGCPVKYVSHNSNSNDPKRNKIERFLKNNNFSYDYTDYFEVEHMFCSFPCVKSYIMNKLSITPSSYKYTNALTYLALLYKKLFLLKTTPIIPSAHDIDSLNAYDGHLSISEYRNTLGVLQFDKYVNVKRPLMFASFSYMEETAARTEKDYM